jgi:hypothetical protein
MVVPVLALVVSTASMAVAQPAQFVIVNLNAPGVGFNDTTPVAPVGGNTGTTLGAQRLIAFEHAASIWAQRLSSPVPVRIRAQFTPLGPGILGSAGPISVSANSPNTPLANTWYHVALANSLAGFDLAPPSVPPSSSSDDINANFSSTFPFYLGLDNQAPAGQPDLVAVLLHEFAHGLGFSQFASLTTGALFGGLPDGYNSNLFDLTLGKTWNQMTDAERAVSATRFGRVVWNGATVTAGVPSVLNFGSPEVEVLAPAAISGVYQFGTAAFGPRLGNPNVQGSVVAAEDAADPAGPSTTDGCTPLTNAAAVAGSIALIERGTCTFATKARNASEAGALGVVIYNNAANVSAGPPGMANDPANNGAFVTAPTVSLRRADGLAILAQLPAVTASLAVDQTVRAGASVDGRVRAFAPFPVASGSSISHYDSVASRNLLMEPAINADLTHRLKAPDDLTSELMYDIGWKFPDADGDGVVDDEDACIVTNPATIVIGGIDTGVENVLFANGCTMSDLIAQLKAGAANHGDYVSGVAALTNGWRDDALMSGRDKGAVQSAAARNNTP